MTWGRGFFFFLTGSYVTDVIGMGGHYGTVSGEHRRMRLPTVRQLFPVRSEIRSRRQGTDRPVQQHQPTADLAAVPAR